MTINMQENTIFDFMYPTFKVNKKIRLIELFAGIGSQAKALRNLGADFETYRVVEFDKYAITSYNAVHGTQFTVSDIRDIHADDLGIVDRDQYCYICTYSFPCQDLSLSGLGNGMTKGKQTRSGLLWEVERILDECGEDLPQVLLMENVPNVIGRKNIKDFQLWETKLEHLGYMNFVQILNAKDYGIPQNRARCFMVSILGQYNYEFPKKVELKLRLKNFLDNEVDEKYFLSEKMLETVLQGGTKNWFMKPEIDLNIARPLTATMHKMHRAGCDNYVSENYIKNDRKYFLIPEATKKGFQVACDGDGVYINRPHQKRGTVQKGMIQTIKTEPDIGTVVEDVNFSNKLGGKGIRIRKLTPCEAWRLMGFTDIDFEKARKVNSDTQLYKQAGNSIVVQVLEAIIGQML